MEILSRCALKKSLFDHSYTRNISMEIIPSTSQGNEMTIHSIIRREYFELENSGILHQIQCWRKLKVTVICNHTKM